MSLYSYFFINFSLIFLNLSFFIRSGNSGCSKYSYSIFQPTDKKANFEISRSAFSSPQTYSEIFTLRTGIISSFLSVSGERRGDKCKAGAEKVRGYRAKNSRSETRVSGQARKKWRVILFVLFLSRVIFTSPSSHTRPALVHAGRKKKALPCPNPLPPSKKSVTWEGALVIFGLLASCTMSVTD